MRSISIYSLFAVAFLNCARPHREAPPSAENEAPRSESEKGETKAVRVPPPSSIAPSSDVRTCFADESEIARTLGDFLDRAKSAIDRRAFTLALRCADEAIKRVPNSIEALLDRSQALLELGNVADARTALERALILNPDDPETLAAAADFFINHLPAGDDVVETGLELAKRGTRVLQKRKPSQEERMLLAKLALFEAQAHADLGHARLAMACAEIAIGLARSDKALRIAAEFERGSAAFELCRFEEARRSFTHVLGRNPDHAAAHHMLGLVLERFHDPAAEFHLAEARRLAPDEFHAPYALSLHDFSAIVSEEAQGLPDRERGLIENLPIEVSELPSEVDLTLEDPPLSPTLLGLFRGRPEREHARPGTYEEPRSIVLYHKNLMRVSTSIEELRAEVRKTLLHEAGHADGEDDADLKARGLE